MKKKMNKNLTVGLWLTGIMLTLILVGFFWTPYNPETMDNAAKMCIRDRSGTVDTLTDLAQKVNDLIAAQ